MELTTRQLIALLRVIGKARLIEFYNTTLSYASVQGVKLPSLQDFMGVSLKESGETSVDPHAAKTLDAHAEKLLKERLAKFNGRK